MIRPAATTFWSFALCIAFCLHFGDLFASGNKDASFPEIKIFISKSQFSRLQSVKGSKLKLKNVTMIFNADTFEIKDMHLRGNNTLNYQRKSLSVELKGSRSAVISGQTVSLKKFDLLNLAMDKDLWHNRWSYLNLTSLGLFPCFNSFCLLWINGQSQGLYLLVEKPQEAISTMKSPYMIRRGANHVIDKEYDYTGSKEELKKYRMQYSSIYKTGSLKGKDLYDYLSKIIDMDLYFKWIGFNYLVMNGDYADELFLYQNAETGLFEFVAWDYDDLLLPAPHEGKEARSKTYPDRLIFSLEDDLDKIIISDDYVYSQYLLSFKQLLEGLNSAKITSTSQKVMDELSSICNDNNCQTNYYLDKSQFDLNNAKSDIEKSTEYLQSRRSIILKELNNSDIH